MAQENHPDCPVLEAQNLSYGYEGKAQLFSDISFSLEPGDIFVLLGPNGCGKTTLLNCLAGLLKTKSGDVRLSGESLARMKVGDVAKKLGYVPQIQNAAFDFTVSDYMVMGRAPYLTIGQAPGEREYQIVARVLRTLHIEHLAAMPFNQLSGGERQQVQIGRVLTQDTRLILLDEPTNHLDYGNQFKILRLISDLAREGYAILMTSHVPDRAIILESRVGTFEKGGGFRCGPAGEVLSEELLREMYDIDIHLHYVKEYERRICIPESITK